MLLCSLSGIVWALQNATYVIMLGFAPTLMILGGASTAEAGVPGQSVVVVPDCLGAGGRHGGEDPGPRQCGHRSGVGRVERRRGPDSVGAAAAIVLLGLCGGLSAAATVALLTEILSAANRGPGLGVFITWYYMAMAGMPPVAGWFAGHHRRSAHAAVFRRRPDRPAIPVLGLFRIGQRRFDG